MWQLVQLAPVEPALWKWCARCVELLRHVAAGADPFRRAGHLEVVRVVAIGAAHALRVHLALQKRSVLVDLVQDLPVGVVETLVEQRRAVVSA